MYPIVPVILCVAGMASVYATGRRYTPLRVSANVIGWGLITASLFLWVPISGREFAVVYAFLILPMVAWVFVVADPKKGNGRTLSRTRKSVARLRSGVALHQSSLFFAAVPLAAFTSTLVALETATWLPWSEVDQLVTGVLVMPVIWGLLSYWVCATSKPSRPTVAMMAAASFSALFLFA